MVYMVAKRIKGHTYYYLYKSYRVKGSKTVKHKFIKYLGKAAAPAFIPGGIKPQIRPRVKSKKSGKVVSSIFPRDSSPQKTGVTKSKEYKSKEILITKEYKTMNGFIAGVRAALKKVRGYDDDLTSVIDYAKDERTVEERIRAFENVYYDEGESGEYRYGFEFEFPDKIYVHYDIFEK